MKFDKMTMAGGSAGHALAMIYAYRDGKDAPVLVSSVQAEFDGSSRSIS